MALTKPVSVPVGPGVHEEVSEHLAPLGTLIVAKNVRFPLSGEVQARRGTRSLSVATSADITYASLVAGAGPDYLRGCPGGFLFGVKGFGYRYDFGESRVHVAGSYGNALPSGKLVSMAREELQPAGGTAVPWPLSQAYSAGYVAVLYSSGNGQGSMGPATGGWFCQIFTAGGTLAASLHSFAIGAASAGWVVTDDSTGNFVVIKQDGTALLAAPVTLTASGAVLGAFVNVGTLTSAVSYWGACNWPGSGWALIYQSAATTVTIKALTLGTNVNGSATFANTGVAPLSVYCDETHCYAGYVDVNFAPGDCVARGRVYDNTLTLTSGVPAIEMLRDVGTAALTLTPPLFGTCATAGRAFCVTGRSNGPGIYGSYMRATILYSDGSISTLSTDADMYGMFPVSAPFNDGMIWARNEIGNGIPSLRNLLVDYAIDRVGHTGLNSLNNPKIALVGDQYVNLVSSGYPGGLWRHHLCPPVRIGGGGEWVCGLPRVVRLETHLSTSQGLIIAEWLKFSTEAQRVAVPFGKSALIPGDLVLAEHPWGTLIESSASTPASQALGSDIGFYQAPTGSASPSNTGPGALNVSSTYQYRVVIERIDAAGARYRSAPSAVILMTTGVADDTGTITALFSDSMLRAHVRATATFDPPLVSKLVMHVYRTTGNATSTGAQFYRCTPPQGAPTLASGTATYVDQLSDSNLITRELLYTDGGVLNNDHPASCNYIALSEDRVWLGGLFDTNQLQSSKVLVPGEPPQFSDSPAFRVVLPAPNTGIACQDGATVAFTASAIYGIQGGGPSDQGQGAWDTPRVITRSTGCINGRSVLETSSGVFFQSDRGMEILPRGFGEPQFIGAGVQDTLASGGGGDAFVRSAAVISSDETRTARFCIGGPNVLVYDLDTNAWSVDEYPANVVAICDTDEGAVIALENVSAGGFGFYLETSAASRDAQSDVAADIDCDLTWAAIHPFTIAGWGRFNCIVGMFDEMPSGYQGECTLSLTVGGDPESVSTGTFDMTLLTSPGFLKLTPQYMDGSYVQPRLTTTAGGWRFMGWTLDLDEHGGSRRMAAAEQA